LDQDRTNWQNRARLGFTYNPSPESTIRVTYQFSHINTKDDGAAGGAMGAGFVPTGDWEARTRQDLYEANISRTWGMSTLTIGRQAVDYDWLVGSNQWGEVARAWTGVRVQNGPCEFFAGRLDLDTMSDAGFGSDQHLVYLGHDWGSLGKSTIYYKLDRIGESVYTLGHQWGRENGNTSYGIAGAIQWGQVGGSDLEAWAAMAHAKFQLNPKMRLFASYSTASGGDPSDGTVNTFDDLYPSDHHRLGMMDLVALRNISAITVGLDFDVNDKIGLMASYNSFTLFDEDDAWYQSGNLFNTYSSFTGSGTNLGSEIDVTLRLMLGENAHVMGGFGIFDPGSAINNAFGGNDNATYMFVGLGFKY
jgi:hypothetical protein